MLGLAQRAGKIISGFDLVSKALANHKAYIIVIASDLSENQRRKINKLADNVMIIDNLSSIQISKAIGKQRSIIAIDDQSFANGIIKLFKEDSEND